MTPKYLNLDELSTQTNRFLTLKGKEHPIVEQTVEAFIESNKLIEQLKAAADDDYVTHTEISVKIIRLSVPSIEESELRQLPFASLQKVSVFIRGDDEVEQEATEGDGKK